MNYKKPNCKRLWLLAILFLFFGGTFVPAADEDFDPLSPPPILKPVPEKYADSLRHWQGISSLASTSNTRLWVCWYSGGITECYENYVLLATSNDSGETWSKPILAIDPPGMTRAFDPAIWCDPTGRLWLFWAQGEECPESSLRIWDGRAGVWAITTENPEDGENAIWSEPRRISDGIMMGKPIVDSKNRWLFPVSVWRFGGKYAVPSEHVGVSVWYSTDEGKTIEFLGISKADPAISLFDEHNIVEMKDGSFKMFARTRYGIGETVSTDGGKTWTDLAPSTIKHTSSRFFIRRLQSGNLLLVKNGPADKDVGRSQMMAMISCDDGQTWEGGLMLDGRGNVSYPDGNQVADGMIYVTYDYDRYNEREIYAARFTEEDVLAGKLVNEKSKLAMLVNKATGIRVEMDTIQYTPKNNDDGSDWLKGDRAEVKIIRGKSIDKFDVGATLFSNRNYIGKNIPEPLRDKNFVCSDIEYTSVEVTKADIVYVITPLPDRNKDSLSDDLETAGFSKVKQPEFLFFGNIEGNISTVYQKKVEAGEKIQWDKKWGVLVF